MKNFMMLLVIIVLLLIVNVASADTFSTGENQFEIDFVEISGDASNLNGKYIGRTKIGGFIDPANDYRMGKYEITNDQWNKFVNVKGVPTGSPSNAYDNDPTWLGANNPVTSVSWYEIAQFVNYLNTSTGNAPAYKFTGTQGTSGYSLGVWNESESAGGTNPYRHKDAYYFLPTDDEWVKAAYWNGTTFQYYATVDGSMPIEDVDANYGYYNGGAEPWDVGSGSEELNGTFDMMGNVLEWMENPFNINYSYLPDSDRVLRGGSYEYDGSAIVLLARGYGSAWGESPYIGFRVASVPEPGTLVLLTLGGFALRIRRSKKIKGGK